MWRALGPSCRIALWHTDVKPWLFETLRLSLQSVIKNSFASATGSLKSSDVYNEGQNILEKIAESNEATLERLERERLWRITNGYEDGATSIPVGGLKKQNDVRGESKFKSQATKLDEGSQQLKISDEVKPVSSSIPDDTTTENDDDSTPPPNPAPRGIFF